MVCERPMVLRLRCLPIARNDARPSKCSSAAKISFFRLVSFSKRISFCVVYKNTCVEQFLKMVRGLKESNLRFVAGAPGLEPGSSLLESDSLPLILHPHFFDICTLYHRKFAYHLCPRISYRDTTMILFFLTVSSVCFLIGLNKLGLWDIRYF